MKRVHVAKSDAMRAFISIDLTDTSRRSLVMLTGSLASHSIRCVQPHGIHLTLRFLGSLLVSRLDAVIDAMADAAEGIPPFSLSIGGLGAFPSLSAPRVIWAGVEGDLILLRQLRTRIEYGLEARGFTKGPRSFVPHITLARVHRTLPTSGVKHIANTVESVYSKPNLNFTVDRLSLIESTLNAHGATYKRRGQIHLRAALA